MLPSSDNKAIANMVFVPYNIGKESDTLRYGNDLRRKKAPMADPLDEFLAACAKRAIIILGNAETSARTDFNLRTKKDIQIFIQDGNLEEIKFINQRAFEKNPDFIVYAYEFFSGKKYGYMAIFFNGKRWFLKSFKLNLGRDPRGIPFSVPLGSLIQIGEKK